MKITDLVLASSWPPRRDSSRYDVDWVLYITDLWRVVCGVPSVFS